MKKKIDLRFPNWTIHPEEYWSSHAQMMLKVVSPSEEESLILWLYGVTGLNLEIPNRINSLQYWVVQHLSFDQICLTEKNLDFPILTCSRFRLVYCPSDLHKLKQFGSDVDIMHYDAIYDSADSLCDKFGWPKIEEIVTSPLLNIE